MQCEEIREQFADYVIDQIQESDRRVLDEHLNTCRACRGELEELKTLWGQLGRIPSTQPESDLRARFDLMLQAYQGGLQGRARKWYWPVLQAGIAAALLIVGVAIGYHMHAPAVPSAELTELRTELSQTRQMVAVALMQQQSATDRLKGVNWSYRLQEPSGDVLRALLDTLMHDSNVNVRLATVDALRQFGNQSIVRRGVVEAMTREDSPMVQMALIDLAVDLREKDSISSLRQLIQGQNIDQAVRDRAQKGLEALQ